MIACFAAFWRNPTKAAIAATAEHLAGLLPLHLVYSHAHETAVEVKFFYMDLWSVIALNLNLIVERYCDYGEKDQSLLIIKVLCKSTVKHQNALVCQSNKTLLML